MKTKAWGAVVMVAFAWVLWRKQNSEWGPLMAYGTYVECRVASRLALVKIQKTHKAIWLPDIPPGVMAHTDIPPGMMVHTDKKGLVRTNSFYCFPQNFNPRPKK